MSDLNNGMRMPMLPNGMPIPPMMNPMGNMPPNMGHPPFLPPGAQRMPMYPPQQMPGMLPPNMPPGMMNQFQQYPMQQPPIMNSYQPVFNMQNQPPPHMMPPQQPHFQMRPPEMPFNSNDSQPQLSSTLSMPPSAAQTNQSSQDSQWRKLFVNNIHPDIPEDFIKKLLEECGQVEKWKRSADEKGNLNSFGIVEFKLVEGVLKCVRLLDGFEIIEEKLVVKPSQTTQKFIEEWKKLKRKQFEDGIASSKDENSEEAKFSSFDEYLEKDDQIIKDRINLLMRSIDEKVEKVRERKREEEERKMHPKERERESKKKQQQREIDRRTKDKLNEWLDHEEEQTKEKKREKEREKDRERNRLRILEKELSYNDDVERHKHRTKLVERKRQRQKEMDEDENDRRREYELLNPPEPAFNIPMPEEDEEDQEDNTSKKPEIIETTFRLIEETDFPEEKPQENEVIEYASLNPRDVTVGKAIEQLNVRTHQQFQQEKLRLGLLFPQEEMEEEKSIEPQNINLVHTSRTEMMENKNKPIKNVFGSLEEEEEEERLKELRKVELPKIGSAARQPDQKSQSTNGQTAAITETPVLSVPAPAPVPVPVPVPSVPVKQFTEEEMKNGLKEILSMIPPISDSSNVQLFSFPFNWDIFEKSKLLESKVKPYLLKKSKEWLGQEELSFVELIVKKIVQRCSPDKLVKHVYKVLDDESEKFIATLWRMMIFETLKYERFSLVV